MKKSDPKLKHCPFCGGPAIYQRMNPVWEESASWAAMCVYGHATSPDQHSKEDVAKWWNRRPKRKIS